MAQVIGEKNLAGSVKIEIADAFLDSIPSGFKKKHAVSAAAQIWLALSDEERKAILVAQKDGISLEDIIESIVQKVLARLDHAAGLKAVQAQKRKRKAKPSRAQ